jgi:hypothetical protein
MYDFFQTQANKTLVYNCSRRLGKSFFLTILAIEQCLKKPKSIVVILQPEIKMLKKTIRPIMNQILEDCPAELRPNYKTQDTMYVFPNGSEIHLAGSDNGNYEKLRGGDTHLAIIDEAGFCNDLHYIIYNILIPTSSLTKGKIILSSTTPPNPDHEFNRYMELAELHGTLCRKTIYDAIEDQKSLSDPRITDRIIAEIVESLPEGVKSEAFRSEYLCEILYNTKEAVIPEFIEEQEYIVMNWLRPAFYDRYVAMDVGFEDLTVVLFAYYDFDKAVVVIEDELVINGPEMTSRNLAAQINQKEAGLWTNPYSGEVEPPYLRVSDNNLILINDLYKEHRLYFVPTDKHNKDQYINRVRNMIRDHQIVINPRCKTLITHLKSAGWNRQRTDFKRSPDNGHYDALSALIYLIRNIKPNRNPYPKDYHYFGKSKENMFFNEKNAYPEKYEKMKDLFIRKSSLSKT